MLFLPHAAGVAVPLFFGISIVQQLPFCATSDNNTTTTQQQQQQRPQQRQQVHQ